MYHPSIPNVTLLMGETIFDKNAEVRNIGYLGPLTGAVELPCSLTPNATRTLN
ncbi:MAG: hypothetical protein BWY67_02479 [Bacteroidetes bacterium ADurb.Bin397]|nr:MAG: hypothetical protein BWY67_02479 [Bacteroidetes bacterium ADurb.Bin397]